jgi:hypothetical protein
MGKATSVSDLERAEHLGYADSKGVKRVSVFNDGVQVNAATEEGIQDVVTAIGTITVPPPVGGATEAKQDTGNTTLEKIMGFDIPKYTQILATYPDTSTEVYTYKNGAATVGTITVVYSDAVTKQIITSVTLT